MKIPMSRYKGLPTDGLRAVLHIIQKLFMTLTAKYDIFIINLSSPSCEVNYRN